MRLPKPRVSASWLFNNLVAAFLLPPLNGLLLIGAGWLLWRRRPRVARGLIGGGALLLFVLSLPVVGKAMLRTLEGEPVSTKVLRQAQAIVVLGAGRYREAPEYGGDTVSVATLTRVRYAAYLHRLTGLPLLVSSGKPDGGDISEAEAMRRVLVREFGVAVRWVEGASNNTRENAIATAAMLKRDGIGRIVLVTHTEHMPRAQRAFSAAGLTVFSAPTVFERSPMTPLDFVPQGYGKVRSAMHEWIGLAWYALRS
jgi:uncharacterized SAM-binding protein YcdF (DUF218 family)